MQSESLNPGATIDVRDSAFSLVLGGPLYQLYLRGRMVGRPSTSCTAESSVFH